MSEEVPPTKPVLNRTTTEWIVISGWIVSLVMAVSIVMASVYMIVTTGSVPDTLREWAGICLGFVLNSLFSLVSTIVSGKSE